MKKVFAICFAFVLTLSNAFAAVSYFENPNITPAFYVRDKSTMADYGFDKFWFLPNANYNPLDDSNYKTALQAALANNEYSSYLSTHNTGNTNEFYYLFNTYTAHAGVESTTDRHFQTYLIKTSYKVEDKNSFYSGSFNSPVAVYPLSTSNLTQDGLGYVARTAQEISNPFIVSSLTDNSTLFMLSKSFNVLYIGSKVQEASSVSYDPGWISKTLVIPQKVGENFNSDYYEPAFKNVRFSLSDMMKNDILFWETGKTIFMKNGALNVPTVVEGSSATSNDYRLLFKIKDKDVVFAYDSPEFKRILASGIYVQDDKISFKDVQVFQVFLTYQDRVVCKYKNDVTVKPSDGSARPSLVISYPKSTFDTADLKSVKWEVRNGLAGKFRLTVQQASNPQEVFVETAGTYAVKPFQNGKINEDITFTLTDENAGNVYDKTVLRGYKSSAQVGNSLSGITLTVSHPYYIGPMDELKVNVVSDYGFIANVPFSSPLKAFTYLWKDKDTPPCLDIYGIDPQGAEIFLQRITYDMKQISLSGSKMSYSFKLDAHNFQVEKETSLKWIYRDGGTDSSPNEVSKITSVYAKDSGRYASELTQGFLGLTKPKIDTPQMLGNGSLSGIEDSKLFQNIQTGLGGEDGLGGMVNPEWLQKILNFWSSLPWWKWIGLVAVVYLLFFKRR